MNNGIIWSAEVDKVLQAGIFLDSIGIKNWALSRSKTLDAIDEFLKLNIAILGGDVCEQTETGIELNYDNWFCDKQPGENDLDFVKRSNGKAKEYIEGYMNKTDNIYFILVPAL